MTLELQARQGRPGRDRQAQPDLRGRQVLPGRLGLRCRDRLARLGPQAALVQRVRPGLRDQPATPGLPGLQAQPETRALRVRRGQLARPAQRPLLQAPLGLQAKLDLPVLPGLRDRRAFRAMWAQPDLQGQRGRRLRSQVRQGQRGLRAMLAWLDRPAPPDLRAIRAIPGRQAQQAPPALKAVLAPRGQPALLAMRALSVLQVRPGLRVRPQLLRARLGRQVRPGRLDQLARRLTSLARRARRVRLERLALASPTRARLRTRQACRAIRRPTRALLVTPTSRSTTATCGCGTVRTGLITAL